MKFFGHDCNAGDDPKLFKVRSKYSITGYGIYFRCLEFVGSKMTRSYKECILEPDIDMLSHDFFMSPKKVAEILEYFVEINLFTKTSKGQYQVLSMEKRAAEYMKKDWKEEEKLDKKRTDAGQSTNPVRTESAPSKDSVRLKEKKRSKIKETKPFVKVKSFTTKNKTQETKGLELS